MSYLDGLIPLQTYDDRLDAMLREAVPGSRGVSDWTSGSVGVDWWSLRSPIEFTTVDQIGYNNRIWKTGFEAFYALSTFDSGNKGATRKKLNELLPQIAYYFEAHANMITDATEGHLTIIPGFVPGSFKWKYLGERVVTDKRGMLFTLTFNHRASIQIKES